ncbi:MAG: NADH-quinone oxidoreductase subunit A [Bacteriovoracaceae bacterium]|nr:NADH-quinone oxidoreductase subunit A [Bacteriovoracaceae bacterium]
MSTSLDHVYHGYLPILLVLVIAITIGGVLLLINHLLAKAPLEVTPKKYEVYECGVEPEGSARQQFSVKYYLVGIIFLIFDVEVVFLYPWTIIFKDSIKDSYVILAQMIMFSFLLIGGYLYLRMRGAFDWE